MPDIALREFVQARLIDTLTTVQSNAGRTTPTIDENTIPYDQLEGFDSLSGVETAVLFSECLATEIDQLSFVSSGTGKSLKVKDIVDALMRDYGSRIQTNRNKASEAGLRLSAPRSA
jgi:hypothetical protein